MYQYISVCTRLVHSTSVLISKCTFLYWRSYKVKNCVSMISLQLRLWMGCRNHKFSAFVQDLEVGALLSGMGDRIQGLSFPGVNSGRDIMILVVEDRAKSSYIAGSFLILQLPWCYVWSECLWPLHPQIHVLKSFVLKARP